MSDSLQPHGLQPTRPLRPWDFPGKSTRVGCLRLLRSSPTPQSKSINTLALSFLHSPTLTSIHDHWKNHSLDYRWTFVGKVISLLFNILSRLVITFLPRSKCLLISWLQSPLLRHKNEILPFAAKWMDLNSGTPLHYSCLENPMGGGAW